MASGSVPGLGPRFYYLEASLWRCALYGTVGAVCVAAAVIWLGSMPMMARTDCGIGAERIYVVYICAGLFAGGGAYLVTCLIAQIRLDANGIARRGLFGWKLYSWDAIRAAGEPTMCAGRWLPFDRLKGVGGLKRSLEQLDNADREEILRLLAPEGVCCHLAEVPREFQLGKRLELNDDGIAWEILGQRKLYAWPEVKRVLIRKLTHDKARAQSFEFEFDDDKVAYRTELKQPECEVSCLCDRSYLQQRFLQSKLGEDRLLIVAHFDRSQTAAEAEYRIKRDTKEIRLGIWIRYVCTVLIVAALAIAWIWPGEVSRTIAIIGLCYGPVFLGVIWLNVREMRKRISSNKDFLRRVNAP